jgi:hypothetical protein
MTAAELTLASLGQADVGKASHVMGGGGTLSPRYVVRATTRDDTAAAGGRRSDGGKVIQMTLTWQVLAAVAMVVPVRVSAQLRPPIDTQLSFDIRVPKAPMAASVGDRSLLVYELRVTNLGRRDLAIQRLVVSGDGKPIAVFEGDSLLKMMMRMVDTGDGRAVRTGRQTLVYIAVMVPNDRIPARLDHRFFLTAPDSLAGAASDTLNEFQVAVDRRPAMAMQSPLRGGPWLAANGPGNASRHRRAAYALAGQARISQRYAVDWLMFGPDGTLFHGDSTRNDNWYGYKHALHAVAVGTVVVVKDGIPENVPFAPDRAVPITVETIGGNHVILDLGGGNYAFYAHLVPGSIRVKVGERVTAGQVIGLLGNSGNSGAPHLHFHVGDRPSPLGSEGVPYRFEQFSVLGMAAGFPAPWKGGGTPLPRRRAMPLDNQAIQFQR